MEWLPVIAVAITGAFALIGYAITYRNNLKLEQVRGRLDRVNRQLGDLYGPLLALVSGGTRARVAFLERYRPGKRAFWEDTPNEEEGAVWRLWMTEVFMPLNLQIEKIIVENTDLLDSDHMPEPFLDLVAHVEAYRTVIKRWGQADFSEYVSLLPFPSGLQGHVEEEFARLKRLQGELLGLLGSAARWDSERNRARRVEPMKLSVKDPKRPSGPT